MTTLAAPLQAAVTAGAALRCAPLAAAEPPLARWLLAAWLRPRVEFGSAHLEALRQLCLGPDRGTVGLDLPGLRVERVYDRLVASPTGTPPPPPPADLVVSGPAGPYRVRLWQPGDRMRPRRLRGHSRKVADLFVDARVPRADRARARVAVDASGVIVWVEHLGAAHDVTVEVSASPPKYQG